MIHNFSLNSSPTNATEDKETNKSSESWISLKSLKYTFNEQPVKEK